MQNLLDQGITCIKCHKNCVSSYVSPTNLASFTKKREGDLSIPDTKRLRSSLLMEGPIYNPKMHCLFCIAVTVCILPEEYDNKISHAKRIPSSRFMTDKLPDKRSYKDLLLKNAKGNLTVYKVKLCWIGCWP